VNAPALTLVTALLACAPLAVPASSEVTPTLGGELPCGEGAFAFNASHDSLVAAFGEANVTDETVETEGDPVFRTSVFAHDPTRAIVVTWKDEAARTMPASVEINAGESLWRGPLGLAVGASVADVERLNGRPFEILGWGWDHGGQLWDTQGGALSRDVRGCRLFVFFESAIEITDESLLGDRAVLSNASALRTIEPKVRSIIYRYPRSETP
jgi:hypothetical protein